MSLYKDTGFGVMEASFAVEEKARNIIESWIESIDVVEPCCNPVIINMSTFCQIKH